MEGPRLPFSVRRTSGSRDLLDVLPESTKKGVRHSVSLRGHSLSFPQGPRDRPDSELGRGTPCRLGLYGWTSPRPWGDPVGGTRADKTLGQVPCSTVGPVLPSSRPTSHPSQSSGTPSHLWVQRGTAGRSRSTDPSPVTPDSGTGDGLGLGRTRLAPQVGSHRSRVVPLTPSPGLLSATDRRRVALPDPPPPSLDLFLIRVTNPRGVYRFYAVCLHPVSESFPTHRGREVVGHQRRTWTRRPSSGGLELVGHPSRLKVCPTSA